MTTKTRGIWESAEWQNRRSVCKHLERWYDGKPLDETEPRKDADGNDIYMFPFRLNLSALACDVHRDYARGEIGQDPLFVRAVVIRDNNPDRAAEIERMINEDVWRPSFGGSILQEALLAMNIFGGTVFKLSLEPWDRDLPTGLAVRPILNPSFIKPTFDFLNRWRMIECWFGYEISPDVARLKYGVEARDSSRDPLYMEHWTTDSYRVTIDDQVPKMNAGPLEGDNIFGFVPFYYIPHERATGPWGRSQVAGREKLNKEFNSRLIGVSDAVRRTRFDFVYGTDIRRDPQFRETRDFETGELVKILDIGTSGGAAGSKPPALHNMPSDDLPEHYVEFPNMLLDLWQQFDRMSPVTFGKDDTSSGRITGPSTAQRAWTSTAHADTERLNMTTGKTLVDRDIVHVLSLEAVKKYLTDAGKRVPEVSAEDVWYTIRQAWPPTLPLDKPEMHKQLIEELREKGISIERFLQQQEVVDIEGEKESIRVWAKEMAEIEAEANKFQMQGRQPDGQTQAN